MQSQKELFISHELFSKDPFEIVSNPIFQRIYEIYDKVSQYIREFLNKNGFLEFKSILLGPVTDPGIRGAKQITVDYYGKEYKIMSSAILYKQFLAAARKKSGKEGKIYFFADNLRLEPLETASMDRHLVEFIQVDLEIADADHFDAMKIAEELLFYVISRVKENEKKLKMIWEFFQPYWESRGLKQRTELKLPKLPLKRYTHKEAVDILKNTIQENPNYFEQIKRLFKIEPKKISYTTEIHWEYEWLISSINEEPFFIYDYPRGARGFYDREYPDKSGILMDFDLIYPEGYGEAASGAAREYEINKVIQRMKETGERLEKYKWYLEFLKNHGIPTAGFGIGLERLVRYICALPSIYLTLPYPKIPGIYNL
jgi:asparaginyl-tRNA synthetase